MAKPKPISKEDDFDITSMDENVLQSLIEKDINNEEKKFEL